MPKPRNPEYPCSEKFIEQFMQLLDKKVFQPMDSNTISRKVEYLRHLGSNVKFGIAKLEPAPLKRNLIEPWHNLYKEPSGKIKISKDYAGALCRTLFDHQVALKLDDTDHAIINEFLAHYRTEGTAHQQGPNVREFTTRLFGHNKAINSFVGKEFLIYERIGDEVKKDGKWGIAIGKVTFNAANGFTHVTTEFKYENSFRKYEGIASHDEREDYLFIDQFISDDTPRRTNLVLRMADMDIKDQTIILGHMTYHSKQYNHLLTKTVVMQRITTDMSLQDIGNYLNTEENYGKIPQEIRNFLYHRARNRMSHPHLIISNLPQLNDFLKEHKINKVKRLLNRGHIKGDFYIYYRRNDNTIVEDKLTIEFNTEAGMAEGVFIHSPDTDKINLKKWIGEVTVNNKKNVCVCELSNEKSIEYRREEEEDPILISFCLPNEATTLANSECFQGVITGLDDTQSAPIAYKCLVVKNVDGFLRLEDPRIREIFKIDWPLGLYVTRPPVFLLSNFAFV